MNFANLFHNEPNPRCYLAGETVIQAGEPHKEMLVLLDGEAEVLVGDRVVETEKPGSLFGEMALLGTREARATVRARTDISVAVVDERRFLFLVQQHPTFAIELMRLMADRLENMNRLIE
ncbi:MAG: cyclic nucleotide-binding domain-containing protein [Verrucomicrobiae bacterium]|nr:cyclic nucleotide-binding domain-containing protein [Verrucomicrobiae bacterium]